MTRAVLRVVTACVVAIAPAWAADTMQLRDFTIDAGGGVSGGGRFRIRGTFGQPDADPRQPSTGGRFAVTGGFWVAQAGSTAPGSAIFRNGFE